ncbi:MAG: serine hydrolase [Actinobacteria bacterium]|nr:serine hydrolase [Actinomycetota bacterium]
MTEAAARPLRALNQQQAQSAVAAAAAACSGHVGLAARHLGTGEELTWHPGMAIQTASTVKVAIHAEVMRQARLGRVDLAALALTRASDLTGGSGVLGVMRPGLSCTVADLCTLMIVVSDNTATNMLIDLLGGVDAVNRGVASLGYPGIVLDHKVSMPPPPFVIADPPPQAAVTAPLATATPADLCRLAADLNAGTVVDEAASSQMLRTLRYQQDRSLFPRSYLRLAAPSGPPGPQAPAIAHKTGRVSDCRADVGVLYLPGDGGAVAYCAVADRLADQTMTALAEGDEVIGRLGAIVLARWWPGPDPVPVRPGWLPCDEDQNLAAPA